MTERERGRETVSEPLFISIHLLYTLEVQHIWCTQAFQQFQCAQKELPGLDFELGGGGGGGVGGGWGLTVQRRC